jgi:hypothetical protein
LGWAIVSSDVAREHLVEAAVKWAGAGRMQRVTIPDRVRELHIFANHDEPGRAAAERTASANSHRRCMLHYPPNSCKDWNDAIVVGIAA